MLAAGIDAPAGPQIVREFYAIAVGEFEVLCQTADPAIWHQTCRFGVEEMLAATAGMSSLLQLERPPEHVSGEVRGGLEWEPATPTLRCRTGAAQASGRG